MNLKAELVDSMGSDDSIIRAMLVSTKGNNEEEASYGRINFLMKNRHGTPFEHNSMTFFVQAPICVFREFHRHRIGWSYNEMSGRYRELPANYYMPPPQRPMIQQGKPGQYKFVLPEAEQYYDCVVAMDKAYTRATESYRELLELGIAKEVARMVLPVGLYSEMYATCNARSLMAFLSLRTQVEGSTFPSYPMWEIAEIAQQMEEAFAEAFPLTYKSFNENGRVCP